MHISTIAVSDNDRSSFIVHRVSRVRQACSSTRESAESRIHADREYLSGTRERENRLHTELGDAAGRCRTIVKRNTLCATPRRGVKVCFTFFPLVAMGSPSVVSLPPGNGLPIASPDVPRSSIYLPDTTCHEDIIGTWTTTTSRTFLSSPFCLRGVSPWSARRSYVFRSDSTRGVFEHTRDITGTCTAYREATDP